MKFPQAKAAVAALLPLGQLFLSLYADQTLDAEELKLLAAEVVAVVLVWLVPAPGYVAPQDKGTGHPAEVEAAVQALAPLAPLQTPAHDHEHEGPTGHWEDRS